MVCVFVVLYSRKERLCNSCFLEQQRDLMTTSETETETETDSELSSSPQRDSSPVSESTIRDDTVTNDDDGVRLASAVDSAVNSETNEAEDETMSQSAAAAYNNATWSMRGTAYSAMSWVSGVVSRGFVRPPASKQEDQPAADDNTEVKAADSEVDVAGMSLDIGNDETASAVVADAQSEDANSTQTDTLADAGVAVSDVDNSLSACQPVAAPSDSVVAEMPTHADTTDSVTQPSTCHDSASSETHQSLQPDDTVQRYLFIYECSVCRVL